MSAESAKAMSETKTNAPADDMAKSRVRVAVIGCGEMANRVHYPSLASFDDVEIVGMCDLDAAKLKATAEKFGVTATFTDHKQMLDETKPDAAYVIMMPHVMFDVAADVLQRGIHMFIEKPPGVTTFQAECLAKMAQDGKLVTAVGFQRRYHPLVERCWREVLARGPVNQSVVSFYKCMPSKVVHPYRRGSIDIIHADIIHAVDALRYYCGLSPVKSVASEVRRLDCWYDVTFNSIICFENGAVGMLLTNWRSGRRMLKFEFHTIGAAAFADADGDGMAYADKQLTPFFSDNYVKIAGSDQEYIAQGYLAENRAFIDAVKAGRPPHNSLQDSVLSMRLCDTILASTINADRDRF